MTDDQIVSDIIIPHEGGRYTNDPVDRGGPTRWGITMPVLAKFRGRPVTAEDIRTLTREEAAACYKAFFIRPFDGVPEPLRVNAIDFGVNAGVARAARTLQQIVGAGVDGAIGRQTIRLATAREWNVLYVGARLLFYENLIVASPTQVRFRGGWRSRALSFERPGMRMAARRGRLLTTPVFGRMGKAYDLAA